MKNFIPFNRSSVQGKELEYISQCIALGQIAGGQEFSRRCESLLQEVHSSAAVLMTPSCTHALEMSAMLLGIGPGDEVIVPAYTFTSTANAFVLRGAVPVFCDVRPDTLNMNEALLEALVSERTKAVVPVHYAGISCEMGSIMELANRFNIAVVEDNAHGFLGKFNARCLGTFGPLSTLSFHETKNFSCGEGGALVINDAKYLERARVISDEGSNRHRFFLGEVDRYTWVDIGSSYSLADMLAAYLFAQLEIAASIQGRREEIWQRYQAELSLWCASEGVKQPTIPPGCEPSWHLYYLILPSSERRAELISHLRTKGVQAVFHYQPLNCSEYILLAI